MNELQKTEFEMLKAFVEVCEKLGVKYFLVCGTALGAVKYNGFIPWDDDIDVGLYRKDYEIFCEKAQSLLPENYFLQNYKTDSNFPFIFSKIRDCRTTYIEKSTSQLNINHGAYIDIFPLDGYPNDENEAKKLITKKKNLDLKRACVFRTNENYTLKSKILMKLLRFFGYHKRVNSIVRKTEILISAYDTENSKVICNHGNWQGELEFANKSQYSNGVMVDFEGLKVRVPENYDEYLTQKYGDWRADLPEEEKVGHHFYEVCDLKKPYTDYVAVVSKSRIKIK